MPRKTDDETAGTTALATKQPPRKFEAPDSDLTPYGVDAQQEDYISGTVESPKVRELLDAFGLADRDQVSFPFQHIKRMHGEVWRMRIEPSDDHIVSGQHVRGHRWVYMRDLPEKVGSAR